MEINVCKKTILQSFEFSISLHFLTAVPQQFFFVYRFEVCICIISYMAVLSHVTFRRPVQGNSRAHQVHCDISGCRLNVLFRIRLHIIFGSWRARGERIGIFMMWYEFGNIRQCGFIVVSRPADSKFVNYRAAWRYRPFWAALGDNESDWL